VDVRYKGQGYELHIRYTGNLIRDFRDEHQRRYGYSYPERELELVTLRLRSTIKSPQRRIAARSTNHAGTAAQACPEGSRRGRPGRAKLGSAAPDRVEVHFGGKKSATAIHARGSMKIGKKYSGPAIITEYSATTVVPRGKRFWLDKWENLRIES
jgi:N-methylhydantoinase A